MATPRFHDLAVARVTPEAAGAVALTLAVPPELEGTFAFEPGQFLTLRTELNGEDVRRNYSICSTRRHYQGARELQVGIRPMEVNVDADDHDHPGTVHMDIAPQCGCAAA